MANNADVSRKCYGQACPVGTALDVAGDRWTFLLLRELLGGPARFQELFDGLPGIARNLLTNRLRRLELDGIVHRINAHGASLYALTPLGESARPVVEQLGFWGAKLNPVAPVRHERSIRAIAMALQAILSRAKGLADSAAHTILLEVGGEHAEITLGAKPAATVRLTHSADAHISVPGDVVADFLSGRGLDTSSFELVSGEPDVRVALLEALGGRRAKDALMGAGAAS